MEESEFETDIPVLDLSQGADIFVDFTYEVLNFLVSAEDSVANLEAAPEDKESIDKIFKIFHTIKGLARFLNLGDIFYLAGAAESLIDKVRKGDLRFKGEIVDITLEMLTSIRKLLSLLNEQIVNKGELTSTYHDVSDLIQRVETIAWQKKEVVSEISEAQGKKSEIIKDVDIPIPESIEKILQSANEQSVIDKDVARDIIQDIKKANQEIKKFEAKMLQRQHKLIEERDFAMKLSRQAHGAVRLKNDILASMAHEIRTLITPIQGFSRLLLKSVEGEKQQHQLDTIVTSSVMLLSIVNNILDFAKIEKGKTNLELVPFKPRDLVHDLLEIVQVRLENKPVDLSFEFDQDIPPRLIGSTTCLKQILLNLIDNAIKFTHKGAIKLKVSCDQHGEMKDEKTSECVLRFEVTDSGIGIPENKKDLIFESYTQADISTNRKFGGTGLGLTICRRYVELMGGKIWVESKVDQGSTFFFTAKFKLDDTVSSAKGAEEAIEEELKNKYAALEELSCQGIRVLVAEDSSINQELIREHFNLFGCSGDFVVDGKEAIEKIKVNQYDVCLMDIQMPRMDGLTATKIIRGDLNKNLPIIALTAAATEEERKQCIDIGMNDYLPKPFEVMELKEKIIKYGRRGKDN